MRLAWLVCAVSLLLLGSCSLQTRKRGQSCQRTAQCDLGLACVAGKCSKDLGPIADQSTVPDLNAGSAAAAGDGGAGVDASASANGG